MRNLFIGDDFKKGCIIAYDAIETDIETHQGKKIIICAKFNIYPKEGINYNELFVSMTTKKKLVNGTTEH